MNDVKIIPHSLQGKVTPPASKSDAHRAIICAALAKGTSRIQNITFSEDIKATINCIHSMGADVHMEDTCVTITGGQFQSHAELNCGESGSTLRFLLPVAAAAGIHATITGQGHLPQRPIDILTNLLIAHKETVSGTCLPLQITGKLRGGTFSLPGNISSQYITGLLFALPLLTEESEIVLTSPLESAGYVDMTIQTLSKFGVTVIREENRYRTVGKYTARDYMVEGDWSSAAFTIAAGAMGGEVSVSGLNPDSLQGDRKIVDIIKAFGANIQFEQDVLKVSKNKLKGITIDASQIPDMVPALAAVAAVAEGDTWIHSAERLRIKESDRLAAIAEALSAMGIKTEEKADSLLIHGGKPVGGAIDGKNDHRIVMAFSILAAYAQGETVLSDSEAVAKSYPAFFKDFTRMGGIFHVL